MKSKERYLRSKLMHIHVLMLMKIIRVPAIKLDITKGHNFVKKVGGVLIVCILSVKKTFVFVSNLVKISMTILKLYRVNTIST